MIEDDEDKVVDLDRVRALREHHVDEEMAYVEMLFGANSYAVHAAIRDLEGIRRGKEDPEHPLREPETDYERQILIEKIRWMANTLAESWGLEHLVRPED